jgi:ATP-dependent RNA helicase DDX23/PRP28
MTFLFTDEERYAHPERDRSDRHKRRDRDSRGGRNHPPQQDDRRPPREGYQNVPTGPRAGRNTNNNKVPANSSSSSMPPPPVPASAAAFDTLPEPSTPFVPPMTGDDLSAIRSRYLGVDKKKRKVRKMNDRKFVFDWDAQDDTFSEDSPVAVGSNRQGAQVMFGRGRLAGMDDGGGSGSRKISVDPHLADSLERRRAAKSGLDERHWTEKPLEEMKDRDWRIFREDFSISARGFFIYYLFKLGCGDHISLQVVKFRTHFVRGPSLAFRRHCWSVLRRLATKNHLLSNGKPFLSDYRIVILLASLKQVCIFALVYIMCIHGLQGSGKTAAFVIPMLAFIQGLPRFTEENRHLGPYALIMAPTRELAQQIESEANKFASPLKFKCVSIVGGVSGCLP